MKVNIIVQRCHGSKSSLSKNNRIAEHFINLCLILFILAGNVFFPESRVSANTDQNPDFLQDQLLENTPIERFSDFENNNIPFTIQEGRTATQYLDIESPATLWLADYSNKTAVYSKDGVVFSASAQIDKETGSHIRAIASVPGDKKTAYYLTESNELWKTNDGGTTFTPLSNLTLTAGNFQDVFINPANPQEVFVYWTWALNGNADTHFGALYRSIDGGNSWVQKPYIGQNNKTYAINDSPTNSRAMMNSEGAIILLGDGSISPNDTSLPPGGTTNAVVWRSLDHGQNWELVWNTNNAFGDLYRLSYSRNNPSTWYAAVSVSVGSSPIGVIVSQDNGKTWTFRTVFQNGSSFPKVYDVAVDNYEKDNALALVAGQGVLRTEDGGITWIKVEPDTGTVSVNTAWRINADPNTSGVFWLVGGPFNNESGQGLYRSSDYGETWTRIYNARYVGGNASTGIRVDFDIAAPAVVPLISITDSFGKACPARYGNTQEPVGGPINPLTGGYDYSYEDLSLDTLTGPLSFKRTYSSLAIHYPSNLGQGWTHNHDLRLIFPDKNNPESVLGYMVFKGESSNRYQFLDMGNDTYSPYPGLCSTLIKQTDDQGNVTYQIEESGSHTKYIFNTNGKIKQRVNAQGFSLSYEYDPDTQHLIKVFDTAAPTSRYLSFGYDGQGHLTSVSDGQRTASFGYGTTTQHDDVLAYVDDIYTQVNDGKSHRWQYIYNPDHPLYLTEVKSPLGTNGTTVERTEYDFDASGQGRAVRQFDGLGNKVFDIGFDPSTQLATIVDARGHSSTQTYTWRNTLESSANPYGKGMSRNYDDHFNPQAVSDSNQNLTTMRWSEDGINLTEVIDPLGNATQLYYDPDTQLVTTALDPLQHETTFTYDGLQIKAVNQRLSDTKVVTTVYSYTTAADAPQPPGLVKSVVDPSGLRMDYQYYGNGKLWKITQAGQTTTYTYDGLGRVQSVTEPTGQVQWSCYDLAGHIIRSVTSASAPEVEPCNLGGFVPRADDRVQDFTYDVVGNPVLVTAPNGDKTRTYYDANNRPITTVVKWTGTDLSDNTPPDRNPSVPDLNIRTDTFYDKAGNVIATIAPDGVITRTYYDAANRPISVTQNLADPDPLQAPAYPTPQDLINLPEPPSYNPTYPDRNNTTRTIYDAVGNVIATVPMSANCTISDDGQGHLTASPDCRVRRSYYDALNRLVSVVENLSGQAITDSTPPAFGNQDQNIRTDTVYDAVGNPIASIVARGPGCAVTTDAQGNISANADCFVTRTYYDALNRPEFVVQNLIGKPINEAAYNVDGVFTLGDLASDQQQNLITQTVYDDAGKVIASIFYDIDPANPSARCVVDYDANGEATTFSDLCLVTRNYYDIQGRPYQTIQNLFGVSIQVDICPAYNPASPDRNVPGSTPVYDAQGRTIASTDPLGRVTRTFFDKWGRSFLTVRNLRDPQNLDATLGELLALETPPAYSDADPERADWNISTQTFYDAEGRVIGNLEAQGNLSRTYFDALSRAYKTTRNLTDGTSSVEALLALTEPLAFDLQFPDRNLTAETIYDVAGRAIATISLALEGCELTRHADDSVTASPACIVNRTYYDGLGRSYATVRNLQGQAITDPNLPTNTDANPNNDLTADANLISHTIYSAAGQAIASIGPDPACEVQRDQGGAVLGIGAACIVDRTYYDGLGRVETLVRNLAGQSYLVETPPARETPAPQPPYYQHPDQNVRTDTIYNAAGQQAETIDPNGVRTHYGYDAQGRLTDVYENYKPPYVPGSDEDVHTVYTYGAMGNRRTIQSARSVQEGTLDVTTFTYDKLGRQLSESDPLGNTWRYGYDILGQRISQWDANNLETKFYYDDMGRLERIDYPAPDADVSFTYGPTEQRKTMTDGLGTTTWKPDAIGQITEITDPFNQKVAYRYDGQGRRTSLIYPGGKEVQYDYNNLHRLQTVTDWQNRETSYAYYASGQVQLVTLPNGVTSRYDYDDLGRLRSLEHKQQEELLSSFVYAYNPAGSRIQAIESVFTFEEEALPTYLPLVCGECGEQNAYPAPPESGQDGLDGFSAEQNAYPAPGEEGIDTLAPESGNMDGGDSSGYPAPEQTPEPETSTGLWDQLVQFFRALFQTPSVSAASPVMASFDEALWVSDAALRTQASASIATQPMMTGGLETVQIDYDYDPLYRLTSAVYSDGTSFGYTYDAAGNRRTETVTGGVTTTYDYDAANRLTSVNGVTYAWDKNGNLLSDGVSTYAYDRANRLTGVTGASMTASYQYNGLGDRVREKVNDVTTHFTMDLNTGLTQVLTDGTNTYLYGASRIGQFTDSDSTYLLGDALGSVRQLTDAAGAVTMAKDYQPYGEVLRATGDGSSAYGYTGEQSDASGLIYLRARYYSSNMGRFLTRDTWQGDLSSPMSYNAWLYGYSNPVMYVDPSGHISCFLRSSTECVNRAISLKNMALQLKNKVREGNDGLLPVEAFSQLANDAYRLFDHDALGTMWGLTNVLVGVDPNDYISKALAVVYPDLPINALPWAAKTEAFVGQDWLPYKHNQCSDFEYPGGGLGVCSLEGDWKGEYFDGTANQAYHFWYYAASAFYDGLPLPFIANAFHDPYPLENCNGQDLVKWQQAKDILRQFWSKSVSGTSKEDYDLGIKGMQYGILVRYNILSLNLIPFNPGTWISNNLGK